jgi:hypothetical protein
MRISGIDPIVTIGRGGPIAADALCGECGAGPSRSGWRWNREMGFGCIRVMNCPEWECVGVLPVRVGRLARSFVGDLRHNSGSDRRPEPRLAAQPGMRRTRSCPPMQPGAKPRLPVWRYPSEMALPTWARPETALVPPHSVTGRCPSIRHWHSAAASRSLGPVTVRPRPPAATGTTLTAPRDRGGPRVHTVESVPTPWV